MRSPRSVALADDRPVAAAARRPIAAANRLEEIVPGRPIAVSVARYARYICAVSRRRGRQGASLGRVSERGIGLEGPTMRQHGAEPASGLGQRIQYCMASEPRTLEYGLSRLLPALPNFASSNRQSGPAQSPHRHPHLMSIATPKPNSRLGDRQPRTSGSTIDLYIGP